MKFKFFSKVAKVTTKQFDKYKYLKKVTELDTLAKKDSFLKKALDTITLKRAVFGTIAIAGVSYGAAVVQNYKHENTGCFLYTGNSVCKVKELSCCNKKSSSEIAFCNPNQLNPHFPIDACNNYDEENEPCCRQCDCQYYNCKPNQKLICKKTSYSDALAHLTRIASKGILNSVYDILNSSGFIQAFIIGFVIIIVAILFFKFI